MYGVGVGVRGLHAARGMQCLAVLLWGVVL